MGGEQALSSIADWIEHASAGPDGRLIYSQRRSSSD
jgi:hypothetical protein